ncbi:hypothetical protein [Paenibacillus sp. MMS18-CY102]|uniref:hypothetical protein n=1 Tax=Paenibacillus sp. MMS18-CY102 TaxID=2682849 RepID=UPI0013654927|nr:hypothetical protein [Paenibacillus sp. MMS18-CY102]MWC28717.1 hypothetical protein [Paenibacillus sp. MMS18-CY102]
MRAFDISRLMDAQFMERHNYDPYNDLEYTINSKQPALRALINEHLVDYVHILDIGIAAVINLHEMLVNSKLVETEITFVVLTAKITGNLLSIRNMMYAGMMDSIKCLQRPMIESIDIYYAALASKDFASGYGNITEMYDNKDFWKKNIKDKKVYKNFRTFFESIGVDSSIQKKFFKKREQNQEFFSNSLHSSFNSAFAAYTMPNIDFSSYSSDVFGKITTAYPKMLVELLSEVISFLQINSHAITNEIILASYNEGLKTLFFHNYSKMEALIESFGPKLVELTNEIQEAFHDAEVENWV